MKTLLKPLIAVTALMAASLAFAVDPFTPANALNLQKSAMGNAFSGAFFEVNTGLANNHVRTDNFQDTISYAVSFTSQFSPEANVTETGTRSGSGSGSGSASNGGGG